MWTCESEADVIVGRVCGAVGWPMDRPREWAGLPLVGFRAL